MKACEVFLNQCSGAFKGDRLCGCTWLGLALLYMSAFEYWYVDILWYVLTKYLVP